MVLSTDFVSSPSQWVVVALLGVIITMTGFIGRRALSTQDAHGEALTEAVKTLAVLVHDRDDMKPAVADAVADINDLSAAVAVLQTWREVHERQSEQDRTRLDTIMDARHVVVPRRD